MKKLVGIFVMTLLITTALPAVGTMNDIKPLNVQQNICPIEKNTDYISVTLNPTDDASVIEGYPDSNYGTAPSLAVGWTPVDGKIFSYLKFDTSYIPTNIERVIHAGFHIFCYSSYDEYDKNIVFITFDEEWDENTITFNNLPYTTHRWNGGDAEIYDNKYFHYFIPNDGLRSSENFSILLLDISNYVSMHIFYSKEWYDPYYKPELYIDFENNAPNDPTISGPTSGKTGIDYEFIFKSVDPGGDDVKYFIEWGDTTSEWTGLNPSNTLVKVKHKWNNEGAYNIIVKAQDKYDAESSETIETITITKPRTRTVYQPLLLHLFERFPNLFPILQQLLG